MAEKVSSEERLRNAVEELLSMDILPAHVVQGLGDVLLASETTDMERLVEWTQKLVDEELAGDSAQQYGALRVLYYIAEEFGVGGDE